MVKQFNTAPQAEKACMQHWLLRRNNASRPSFASASLPAAAAAAAAASSPGSKPAAVEVCGVSSGVASTTYKANWVDQITFQWLVYISLETDSRRLPAIIQSRPQYISLRHARSRICKQQL